MREVNDEEPSVKLRVLEVGFSRVSLPARILYGGRFLAAQPVFSALVDLPADRRGIHASRTYEALLEAVKEPDGLDGVCCKACRLLLEKHGYSGRCVVRAEAPLLVDVRAPVTGKKSYRRIVVLAEAVLERGDCRKKLGVEVWGLLACPSAQRSLEEATGTSPAATHTQRGRLRLLAEIRGGKADPAELAGAALSSFSSELYGLLKRPDEAETLLAALSNPVLAEDVVRRAAGSASRLPWTGVVEAELETEESVHEHNFYARLVAEPGDG